MAALGNVLDSQELGELANELTGGTGLTDDHEGAVPDSLAADIEAYDNHNAEKGLQVEQEDQLDDNADGDGRKRVPLSALHQERAKRQALQEQVAQQQAQVTEMNRRFAEWQAQLAQQQAAQQQAAAAQQAEQATPEFSEDPEGYIKAREAQFAQQLAAVQNQQVQRQQAEALAQRVHATVAEIGPELAQTEAAFEQEHPEYRAAFDFMDQQAEAQLAAAAPQASPAERQLLKVLALTDLAMRAKQAGQNPCELIMQSARQRGFQPGQAARQPAVRQELRQAPRQAPTSLSNMAGSAGQSAPSFDLSTIASMSDDQFEQAWAEMSKGSAPKFAF